MIRKSIQPNDLVYYGEKDNKYNGGYKPVVISGADLISSIKQAIPAGAQGPMGPQGIQGAAGPVGPAGLEWQGAWTSGTSYVADDAVGYGGASYFCILATNGTTTPNVDTTHWALLASQGAIGPQGPVGPQGPAGSSISYLEYDVNESTVWNNGRGNVQSNTSFGENCLQWNTTGSSNTGFGYQALGAVQTGQGNTAIGFAAGNITTGNSNTFVGSAAGFIVQTGSNNVLVGNTAAITLTSGSGNVTIGTQANTTAANTNYSVAIGNGTQASTGSVVVGSGSTSGTYNNCIVLGIGAVAPAANSFVVGSSTQAAGAVTTETLSSTKTWTVVINGVSQKILLA